MVLITPKLDIKIDKKYRVKEEETFRGKRRYVRKEISGSRKSKIEIKNRNQSDLFAALGAMRTLRVIFDEREL